MTVSEHMPRRFATVGFGVVAIASCFGLLASFVAPMLDLRQLYRMSVLTREIGFCVLAAYIVAGFALPPTTIAAASGTEKMSSWKSKAVNSIVLGCFLVVVFSPHTYVYPQAGGWITKSKAGTFNISSDVARQYLWRALRMWSTISFCLSFSAIGFPWKLARRAPKRIARVH